MNHNDFKECYLKLNTGGFYFPFKKMPRGRLFPAFLLFATCVRDGLGYYYCPDGSAGLTKQLYEAGDPSKYADVTCIPEKEFDRYVEGGSFGLYYAICYGI